MIQIPIFAGHRRTARDGVSLVCRLWPSIECWLCSFAILRGSGPVLLKKTIFL